jgi:hypothetical protein
MKDKQIEKPWAVYFHFRPTGIGKIVQDNRSYLDLQYSERQDLSLVSWNSKSVERFKTPLEAIDYFVGKNKDYNKEGVIESFLKHFPSEKDNLEKQIIQSSP